MELNLVELNHLISLIDFNENVDKVYSGNKYAYWQRSKKLKAKLRKEIELIFTNKKSEKSKGE